MRSSSHRGSITMALTLALGACPQAPTNEGASESTGTDPAETDTAAPSDTTQAPPAPTSTTGDDPSTTGDPPTVDESSDTDPPIECLDPDQLAAQLRATLADAGLDAVWDLDDGAPIDRPPNVDLAVIAFQPGCPPAGANVLLSNDAADVHVGSIDPVSAAVTDITWRSWSYDRWSGAIPWDAPWPPDSSIGPATGSLDFMVPNPASLFKVLVGLGIALGLDQGTIALDDPVSVIDVPGGGFTGTVGEAMDRMLTASENGATSAAIARLHQAGILPDLLHDTLDGLGLYTLRIEGTQPDGDWTPPGAADTTGRFHMTAWDTARLLWLLDRQAPEAAWEVDGAPVDRGFLSDQSKDYLLSLLADQGWHEVLSTTALCGLPGRQPGIPARMPERWLDDPAAGDYGVTVEGIPLSDDVRPCNDLAEVSFAHKTGLTQNFGSDAGIVTGLRDRGHERHYIVSFIANLGYRYTDPRLAAMHGNPCFDADLCYSQQIASLGRALDQWLSSQLQAP